MSNSPIPELEDKIEALKAKLWDNTLDGDEALREVMAKEGATCTLEEFEKMKKELKGLEWKLEAAERKKRWPDGLVVR